MLLSVTHCIVTQGVVELSNLEHDPSSLQDMRHFVELLSALMDLGAYGDIFYTALQFKNRYELFVGEVEDVV